MEKRKVLVVDDENFIRELVYDFLEFENIECDKAENQEVALELISKNDYDLILLDRNLKDFKSENMIEKIKKDIPIVLLTGEDNTCEDYFRELGISEIISKPFQYDDFMNKINPYLRFK
jgi:DNA-binding response OmpR family regulator